MPLLLVKSKNRYRKPVVLAAVDPSHAYAKPAALEDQILLSARSVQRALRGSLHVVHAYGSLPWEGRRFMGLDPGTSQALKERARAEALARLPPFQKKTKLPAARRHLVAAEPSSGIAAAAKAVASSMIVMGALSRSGLERFFIGNTAEQILDSIQCDVLVVKAPSKEGPCWWTTNQSTEASCVASSPRMPQVSARPSGSPCSRRAARSSDTSKPLSSSRCPR